MHYNIKKIQKNRLRLRKKQLKYQSTKSSVFKLKQNRIFSKFLTNSQVFNAAESNLPYKKTTHHTLFLNFLNLNKIDILGSFFFNPKILKYILTKTAAGAANTVFANFTDIFVNELSKRFFYSNSVNTQITNILPSRIFKFMYKKQILHYSTIYRFKPDLDS